MESQGEEEESECKSLAMLLELNVVFALLWRTPALKLTHRLLITFTRNSEEAAHAEEFKQDQIYQKLLRYLKLYKL